MKYHLIAYLFAAVFIAAIGQTNSGDDPMAAAVALREEMTNSILKGVEKPAQAMARLRAHDSPSGLKVDHEADFALAAIDVGQRLLSVGKATEAEVFFLAAEKSLVLAINKTKDSEAQGKALYLQQLSFIRANFLNEAAAAMDDIDAAIKLQPDDQQLKDRKAYQARDQAELVKARSKK